MLKKTYWILIGLFALSLGVGVYQWNTRSLHPISLPSQDLFKRTLHIPKHAWTIVNYWAPWCEPCLTEMPMLNQIQAENTGIAVIGVLFDSLSTQKARTLIEKLNITYPILDHFPIETFGIQRIDVLPMTFIFNPEGKLVEQFAGPVSKEQLSSLLNSAGYLSES